jgi:hypothetical protein
MKKLSILFLLLFAFATFAQNQRPVGHLTVFSESGASFFMYLNGELQNDTPQTNIRIEDLDQNFYSVKIKFEDKSLKEISKNYVSVRDNEGVYGDVTYKIKVDKNKKTRMNYFSSTPVVQNFRVANDVYVVHGNPTAQTPPVINNGVSVGGINININSPNTSQGQANNNPQHTEQQRGCEGKYEMRPTDFENAKKAISKESFDDAKLKIMFQIIQNNCLSTNQIAQLMKLESFDQARLKVAKFALDYCVDPKNYYTLNALLTFDSSKNELIDYAQSKSSRR